MCLPEKKRLTPFSDDKSKVGLRAVCYYMTTTLIAVTLGILLTITIRCSFSPLANLKNLFRPGLANTEEELQHREGRNTTTTDTLLDLLTNCFPPNLVQVSLTRKCQKPEKKDRKWPKTVSENPYSRILFKVLFKMSKWLFNFQATMQQYKTELIYPGNVAKEDPASGALLDPLVR